MEWLKGIVLSLAALIAAGAFAYDLLVIKPNKQAFSDCLDTFTNEYKETIADLVRISVSDLCQHGFDYKETTSLARVLREETRAQYVQPDNYWIQDEIEAQVNRGIRAAVGLDY